MSAEACVEAAHRIARRLVGMADRKGGSLSWTITMTTKPEETPVPVANGRNLYIGSAGIALFLAEVYRTTGDRLIRRAAIEGAQHALQEPVSVNGRAYALYTGCIGRLYAAARIGEVCGEVSLVEMAASQIVSLERARPKPLGFDVIGGVAGAVPALLCLAAKDLPGARSLAIWLSYELAQFAHRLPDGWAWGSGEGSHRYLSGYSHGAAGAALALAEAASATSDGYLWYGAYSGFSYDQASFDPIQRNWRDYRQAELSLLFSAGKFDAIRDRVAEGETFSWPEHKAMIAWCHGAAGVGLSRFRAYSLTGDTDFLSQALIATSTTAASLEVGRRGNANYSLCHGTAGNCETLVVASEVTRDNSYLKAAQDAMLDGADAYERQGREWPSGALFAFPQPSLLLGDAGIGYAFLRVANVGTPSILLLSPPPQDRSPVHLDIEAAQTDSRRFWSRTRLIEQTACGREAETASERPYDSSQGWASEPSDYPDLLKEAVALDSAEVEMLTTRMSLTQDTVEYSLRRARQSENELPHRLSSRVRIVPVMRRWPKLGSARSDGSIGTIDEAVALVIRSGSQTSVLYATGLRRYVFERLNSPHSLNGLVDALRSLASDEHQDLLVQAVGGIWEQAKGLGLLVAFPSSKSRRSGERD